MMYSVSIRSAFQSSLLAPLADLGKGGENIATHLDSLYGGAIASSHLIVLSNCETLQLVAKSEVCSKIFKGVPTLVVSEKVILQANGCAKLPAGERKNRTIASLNYRRNIL